MTEENQQIEEENKVGELVDETPETVQQDEGPAGDVSVEDMQKKLKDLEEVAKKVQYDYIMLKHDFESFQRRVEQENKENKSQALIDIMQKILPLINQLSYSVEHMPAEMVGNKWADGVNLVYTNIAKSLESMGIQKIATIGESPDSELHEPLGLEPTDDENLKGKIIKEYEAGYILKQGDTKKIIKAAKVIVGE